VWGYEVKTHVNKPQVLQNKILRILMELTLAKTIVRLYEQTDMETIKSHVSRIAWMLNCRWPSPAQSFLVRSPTGLITIFYSLTAQEAFKLSRITSPEQPSKLLLGLASTVVFGFGPRRDPRPYFCSFQAFTWSEMGPIFRREEGSDYSDHSASTGEWLCWLSRALTHSLTHFHSLDSILALSVE
jgi:hypothetical protein